MVRGSLPLTIMVYGGLLVFLRSNLRSPGPAIAIWLAVMAFEVGFTPLQYFRFVGFVPLILVVSTVFRRRRSDDGRTRHRSTTTREGGCFTRDNCSTAV